MKEKSERCDVAEERGHCRRNACDFQKLEKVRNGLSHEACKDL